MEVKSPLINLVFKSHDNYSDGFYGPLKPNESRSEYYSAVQLGCLSGFMIILFSNVHEKAWSRITYFLKSSAFKEFLYVTGCLFVSLFFLPVAILIYISFKLYKEFIKIQLQSDKLHKFKEFMSGEDIVWICENDASKSIINVLAFVSDKENLNEHLPEELLHSIRCRISSKLMLTNQFPKMFYRRRRSNSGYFYWTDENYLTISEYVRFIGNENSNEKFTSEDNFRELMSKMCNEPLPANNTALWECLISRQAIDSKDGVKYPVIFRVHHSIGDGVALLRLILEVLADEQESDIVDNPVICKTQDTWKETLMRFLVQFVTILKTPSVLCTQLLKEIDRNEIHPTNLLGNKKVNWLYESEVCENYPNLLTLVKLLKRQFPGSRFSNILLAALSKSLQDFFKRKNYETPKDMTVVIPARLYNSKESPMLKLENKFSVAMQTLPIDIHSDDRVSKINKYSDIVTSSPDYQINYFMMTVVAAIFPDYILKIILDSKHSTMAVSNLPGPNFAIKINGFEFESVGFFLPNIGQTAVGVTILSYNNRLHFGMMADEAAIDSENDLGEILNGMIHEIYEMAGNLLK